MGKRIRLPILCFLLLCSAVTYAMVSPSNPSGPGVGAGVAFDLRAFIGGTSNQSYTNAQVLDTVSEGVIDSSLTVVDLGAGTVKAVSEKLELKGTGTWDETGLYHTTGVTKELGKAWLYSITHDTDVTTSFGLNNAAGIDQVNAVKYRIRSDEILSINADGVGNILVDVASIVDAVTYSLLITGGGFNSSLVPYKTDDTVGDFVRGFHYFLKGGVFTAWTRIWMASGDNTSTLRAYASIFSATVSLSDDIIVPEEPLNPAKMVQPRFLATYQGTNGDSIRDDYHPDVIAGVSNPGVTALESGADTWDIQGNAARNTPGVGGELVIFGSMSNPAPWDEGTGWSIGSGVATWTHGSGDGTLAQTGILTVGAITRLIYTVFANTSDGVLKSSSMASPEVTFPSTVATHTVYFRAATTDLNFRMTGGTGGAISLDNISARIVTLNRAFTSDDMGIDEGTFDVSLTIPTANDGFAGIVFLLDDKDTPENYGEAIYDRVTGKVELNKYLSSSRTSLVNVTATYSAGAQLRVIAYNVAGGDVELRLFYDQVAIGTVQTLDATTDAAIIGNTRHGQTSVDTDTRLDNFSVMKRTDSAWDIEITRGTGGAY